MPRAPKKPSRKSPAVAAPSGATPRAIIENVQPGIDAGRFAAKRTQGEIVRVEADVFADGHDKVAADLLYRHAGLRRDGASDAPWTRVPMTLVDNDRWAAEFRVDELGFYEFTVDAWVDAFATWRDGLSKKFGAGQDVDLELREGAGWLRQKAEGRKLKTFADRIDGPGDAAARVAAALSSGLADAVRADERMRHGVARDARTLAVMVERERARFGAWYEMFPRSAGPDPTRSATFDEAAERLPAIAAMGFDIVYL
ncbi:MAG: DUF3416 domain-containing protein, partial [Acidobacteria bacterium]|nr:DUF3416 domain-containing protein [Acidobacteriota bacterium]